MNDINLREAIDACRPGSDDLHLPELSSLADCLARDPAVRRAYEQTQRADARLSLACSDVPVPVGLSERILSRLATSEVCSADEIRPSPTALQAAANAAVQAAADDSVRGSVTLAHPSSPAKVLRTRPFGVLWPIGLACTAAVVLFAVWWNQVPGKPLTCDQLLVEAGEWTDNLVARVEWNTDLDQAPQEYAPDLDVRLDVRGWQRLTLGLDSQAVVYDLKAPGSARATLTVIHPSQAVADMPFAPPLSPLSNTGRRSMGAWQRDSTVFVLVVDGPPGVYRQAVQPSAIASWTW